MSMAAGTDKLAASLVTLSTIVPSLFTNDLTTPVLGVGLTTVAGAVLGTFAAIGYDEQPKPRGRMLILALSTVILGSMLVGVVPRWVGWEWANGGVEGALAGLASLACYYLLPPGIKRAGELVRSFKLTDLLPFLKRRDGDVTPTPENRRPLPPEDPEK